jgi:hypothetical protein
MRLLRQVLLGLLIPAAAMAQRGDSVIAIVGGTLIDGNGGQPVPNATVVVRGGRIAAVGSSTTVAATGCLIDAAGSSSGSDANAHGSIYSGLENFARYRIGSPMWRSRRHNAICCSRHHRP